MKIITWNLWKGNNRIKKSLSFIFDKNPDIVCLQEFKERDLKYLNKYKDYVVLSAVDFLVFDKLFKKNKHLIVTAVKKEMYRSSEIIKFPEKNKRKNIIKVWTKWEECKEGLIVDITYKNKKIRILNLHLSCAANPSERLSEMQYALKTLKINSTNIICGDLNVFGIKYYNPLVGWLFGYKFKDYFYDERNSFENLFYKYKLSNLYYEFSTIPFLPLQPDHILVPHEWKIKKIQVLKKSYLFSDHYMLFTEVKI